MLRTTYTEVVLELSEAAYNEIADKLKAAGYKHLFLEDGSVSMKGICIAKESSQ